MGVRQAGRPFTEISGSAPAIEAMPLCGPEAIASVIGGRDVTLRCHGCGAVGPVACNPPDVPTWGGRTNVPSEPLRTESADTRQKVLLVDDDGGFLETFAALLCHEGSVVVTKRMLAGAIQYLTTRRPDLLITDVRLDTENGWNLAKYAQHQYPALGVMVVTGFAADHEDAEAEYWRLPVFLKPFDPDDARVYPTRGAPLNPARDRPAD